jgi:hypothetical protein
VLRARQSEAAAYSPELNNQLLVMRHAYGCLDTRYIQAFETSLGSKANITDEVNVGTARADISKWMEEVYRFLEQFGQQNQESIDSCDSLIVLTKEGENGVPSGPTTELRQIKVDFKESLADIEVKFRSIERDTLDKISEFERAAEAKTEALGLHRQLNSRCPAYCNSRRKIVYRCSGGRKIVVTEIAEKFFQATTRQAIFDAVESEELGMLYLSVYGLNYSSDNMRKAVNALTSGRGGRENNLFTLGYCACATSPEVPGGCEAVSVH